MTIEKRCCITLNDDEAGNSIQEVLCHFEYYSGQAHRQKTWITPSLISKWPETMMQLGVTGVEKELLLDAARTFVEDHG